MSEDTQQSVTPPDLSSFRPKDTKEVPIDLPGGKPSGIIITIYGSDSKQYKDAEKAQRNARLERMQKGRGRKLNADIMDNEALDLVVSCVSGWSGVIENKVAVPFTAANAKRIFTEHAWMFEQVQAAMVDRTNFFES